MSVIVNDTGFAPNDWDGATLIPAEELAANADVDGLDLGSDASPETLAGKLDTIKIIRIAFPSFADGRGFTIARQLRLMGYTGHLRAYGHVIADQYAMARRSGFDDVEIDDDLAKRQDEAQWLSRADWKAHDYQSRLRAAL